MAKQVLYYAVFLSFFALTACQKEVDIAPDDLKKLGASAHDLLSADRYTSLVVEIDYMPGFAPEPATIHHLKTFLNTFINKPDGIQITTHPISTNNATTLSISELVQLEKKLRSAFTLGSTLAVYILITDASFSSNANTLALSYWNTSTCLFGKSIGESSGGTGQVSRSEMVTTLLEHEFGHLMGLVDQGSAMQTDHRDINNGAHCVNQNCLMYYNIETVANSDTNYFIPILDMACQSDLKANGGK